MVAAAGALAPAGAPASGAMAGKRGQAALAPWLGMRLLLAPKLLLLLPPGLTSQMATLGLTQLMTTLGLTQQMATWGLTSQFRAGFCQKWSETGRRASVWRDIGAILIPRGLGTLWDASRAPKWPKMAP